MSPRASSSALFAALWALFVSCPAAAQLGERLRRTTVTLDLPAAIPLSDPLRDRFGMGAMPALSAMVPWRDWALVGLRYRWGFLSDGPAPADPTLKDPGRGGIMSLLAVARLRPSANQFHDSLVEGPWLEVGGGAGLTGGWVRATGEVALGWNMRVAGLAFGPAVRYVHVFQPDGTLDGADARMLLLGLEVALHDSAPSTPKPDVPVEPPKPADRDGDGVSDDVDKCPDQAEDKDGFQDDDGCPDLDNDGDNIPDENDACPNEPETVNGFEDEDGCPDTPPEIPKEERILLEERVLFDTDSTSVSANGRAILAAVVSLWKQHPEWDRLVIDGHADRRGAETYNLQLSRDRARQVLLLLVDLGLSADKLRIRAFGNRKPRMPGEEAEADRQNRRVEFVVVKKHEEAAPAPAETPATPPAGAKP